MRPDPGTLVVATLFAGMIALPTTTHAKGPTMPQQVYAICFTDDKGNPVAPCKIGIARDPQDRLRTFQTANPNKLTIVKTWRASSARKLELAVHRRLAPMRMEGEWFDVSPGVAIAAVHTVAGRPRRGFGPWLDRMWLRVLTWWRGR